MSDVKLFQTLEDGEIEVKNGVVTMDGGLQTALFVSLFGAEDWWGNLTTSVTDQQITSSTMRVLRENALTTGLLTAIEDAVKTDIGWVDGDYTVTASIPQLNRVQIDINFTDFTVSFQAYADGFVPDATSGELITPSPKPTFQAETFWIIRDIVIEGTGWNAFEEEFLIPAPQGTGWNAFEEQI